MAEPNQQIFHGELMIFLLLQIGELFSGRFNWRGVLHLSLFIIMALIAVGFGAFIGYKAFRSKK